MVLKIIIVLAIVMLFSILPAIGAYRMRKDEARKKAFQRKMQQSKRK